MKGVPWTFVNSDVSVRGLQDNKGNNVSMTMMYVRTVVVMVVQ